MNTPIDLPVTRLGPNDTLPCGTPSARRRHLAQGRTCTACGVTGEQLYDLERAERAA